MPHHIPGPDGSEDVNSLRAALVQGNRSIGQIGTILGHLLATPDRSLFNDEIVARVRGMLDDLARQILRAQAEATGHAAREEFAALHGDALAAQFQERPSLLAHCHALALEWQLTSRMEELYGNDPVLSPLMQDLIADDNNSVASGAMASLASQARFAQTQRRMELPLAELPGDLFHEALVGWRAYNGSNRSDAIVRAEAKLRNGYDESDGRLALLARLVTGMGPAVQGALDLERAGVALFFTALAAQSGQTREMAVISSNERQVARLTLGMRAAGASVQNVEETILKLHPEAIPPQNLQAIGQGEAAGLLLDGDLGRTR